MGRVEWMDPFALSLWIAGHANAPSAGCSPRRGLWCHGGAGAAGAECWRQQP